MIRSEEDAARRVVFYGVHDLAAGWHLPRVAELVEGFDPATAPTNAMGIIELHNVQQYLENGFLPHDYPQSAHAIATAKVSQLKSVVAQFFSSIDSVSCESLIEGIDHEYHADLLELLGRYKAFERCDAALMLRALDRIPVHLGRMLACKRLVNAYDTDICDRLLASPRNAEHLIRKYLQGDVRDPVHLPRSLSASDARTLLERYIDDPDANPNFLELIESAPISTETGIDAKLKLRARRRSAEWTEKFFQNNQGFTTGTEVGLSDSQTEPLKFETDESDGLTARFTYSRAWLDETNDNPSILNNFQHLFEFADCQVFLTLPSYPAQLGVFERFMGTSGRTHYRVGAAFRAVDMSSFLQTRLYLHYLENKGRDLESVISWFFEEYLPQEFEAANFSFRPSSPGASYLERVRHLFAEMESILTQFTLWVENGHIDPDLLAMTSDPVRYKQVPSLLDGKYVYPSEDPEIAGILHALFSDQSTLTYISDDLKGDDAVGLLLNNDIAYEDLHEYQQPAIGQLIAFGILENTGKRIVIADAEQLFILRSLFYTESCSYYHLAASGRGVVDAMVARGWVVRKAFLLTEAEGRYFNYFLNRVEYSNGPELRNKYVHGSQANGEGEDAHFHAYVTVLRLIIALVIKLNDDLCLWASEQTPLPGVG